MAKNKDLKKAVALGYKERLDNAPKVLATGKGKQASKMIQLAKEHGVPIKEDEDLVEMLSKLDLGDEIPQNLYKQSPKSLFSSTKWQIKNNHF